jgi:TonB family protein
MDWPCKKWTLACAILVASLAFAGKKETEEEGKMLLDRAVKLSEIRAAGAPPFRLTAKFKIMNEDSNAEGTYTETWLSPGQWRRETALGDLHRTVVANGPTRWTLGSVSPSMPGISDLGFPMDTLGPASEFWKADKIEDRQIRSSGARCIETKADSQGSRSALCFAKDKGILLAKAWPAQVRDKIVESTCEYRDYQEFGGKVFPRQILCFDALRPVFEETTVELSPEPSPDPALFAPLLGGKESANCQGAVRPPTPAYSPDPDLPRRETPKHPVDIELLVQADGKVSDLKVVRSIDEAFDQAALKAVRKWRFKPATCDGVPMTTHIYVSVAFRTY